MDHKTNRFPRFQEGTCGRQSGALSSHVFVVWEKEGTKRKGLIIIHSPGNPVSFIMVHIATVWVGNHGNCPSQTRQ